MKLIIYFLTFLVSIFLQAESSRQFSPVVEGRTFQFPRDHNPHLGFKTEWWYYTGFLETNKQETIGIQFTLFKIELEPAVDSWNDTPILMVTHLGIANISDNIFESYTDHTRLYPGLAQFRINQNGFEFKSKGKDLFTEYNININKHKFHVKSKSVNIFDSEVVETIPILLHGNKGFSRKDFSDLASYYYSVPELKGKATVHSNGKEYSGNMSLWLDREFSSKFLQKEKKGWDWVHFTMPNGDKFLAFQVRDSSSNKNFSYGMKLKKNTVSNPRVIFTPRKNSRLSSQNTYPTEWTLKMDDHEFLIKALIYDSEMKGILPYWEGPIQVTDTKSGETGRGYLEMTGYGKNLPDWL